MSSKTKKNLWKTIIQFLKLQAAGNVLFWGTYLGYFIGDNFTTAPSIVSVAVASIIAHVFFFVLNKNWVFSTKTGKAKTRAELVRFIIFMTLNYFLNLGIIFVLENYFGITPYIGQLIASVFFTFWTWLGLKFWVFRHVRHAHHYAITIETEKTNAKRHDRYQRLATKQEAKRASQLHR